MVKKLYAERNARKLEPHYSAHVSAMTAEGLYAKSDIAAELAFRDAEISSLKAALDAAVGRAIDDALSRPVGLPSEEELLGQLTEKEVCELSTFMPNLACLAYGEPPSHPEETRALARRELAALLRRRR